MPQNICKDSGKIRYAKKTEALAALRYCKTLGRSENGVYMCRGCKGGWHLTKKFNPWTPMFIRKIY